MLKIFPKLSLVCILVALMSSGCISRNAKPTPGGTSPIPRANAQSQSSTDRPTRPDLYNVNPEMVDGSGLNAELSASDQRGVSILDPNMAGADFSATNPNILESIFFGFDQSAIPPAERAKLKIVAEEMKMDPAMTIVVEGHCDWRGTVEYNMALSERRAKSVQKYLGSLGIAASRIEILPKGDLEATTEATSAQMTQDRRADIIPVR